MIPDLEGGRKGLVIPKSRRDERNHQELERTEVRGWGMSVIHEVQGVPDWRFRERCQEERCFSSILNSLFPIEIRCDFLNLTVNVVYQRQVSVTGECCRWEIRFMLKNFR